MGAEEEGGEAEMICNECGKLMHYYANDGLCPKCREARWWNEHPHLTRPTPGQNITVLQEAADRTRKERDDKD